MERQARWVRLARPAASSLKFRLPYEPGATRYFAAPLRVQAWAPVTTNETRQEFAGVPAEVPWDHRDYDFRLNYLNRVAAQWGTYGAAAPAGVPGADRCLSCALEAAAWEEYLAARGAAAAPEAATVADLMNLATAATRQRLAIPPHGVDPETPMAEKRRALLAACEAGRYPCWPQLRDKQAAQAKMEQSRARQRAARLEGNAGA